MKNKYLISSIVSILWQIPEPGCGSMTKPVTRACLVFILGIGLIACESDKAPPDPDPTRWKTYTMDNSALINNYVNCVAVDSNDRIWVGNYYGDVTEFDGAEWRHHVTVNSGVFNNTIRVIAVDHDNTIWAGSDSGLHCFKNDAWTSPHLFTNAYGYRSIADIAIAPDNTLWITAFRAGLWHYDSGIWSSLLWSPYENYANRITVTPAGDIWLTSGNYVIFFDKQYEGFNITTYTAPRYTGIPVMGKNGMLWVTSPYYGLSRFDGLNWISYNSDNSGLPRHYVRAIALDKDDDPWIGTDGGLVHFDGSTWTIYNTENSGLLSNYITGIAFDSKNNIWVSTFGGGLSVFDPNGL